LDLRLFLRHETDQISAMLATLQQTFTEKSQQHQDTLMPGYTHMQPAQPITAGHWLMSFFWMLSRDRQRLSDIAGRTAVSPLGSGALAGTPFDVDRALLASELGFQSYTQNSLDGVSDASDITQEAQSYFSGDKQHDQYQK